jgi:hypothetical protein
MNWIKKIFDRIGAPVAASISADIATVKAKSDYLQDMEDGVYFDSVTGGAGTDWPVGTAQSPSNVIASVITMCTARKTKKIYVNGAVTLGATMEGYTFVGVNKAATITLNSQDVDTSHFYNCTITGVQGGTGKFYSYNCIFNIVSECDFEDEDSTFICNGATISPRSSADIRLIRSAVSGEILGVTSAVIDCTDNTNITIKGTELKGDWWIQNSINAGNLFSLGVASSGIVSTHASDTLGSIVVMGCGIFGRMGTGISETDLTRTRVGNTQVKVATVDLHNGAGALDVATCATEDVIVDSIIFSPRVNISDDAGAFTGMSIQDNDTTVHTFISQANGIKANLTQYAQLSWTGAIKVRVGNKIQCTIYGGSADANPTTCDVEITYHATVDGGTL